MTTNIQTLSRLMKLSWDIQRQKNKTRGRALQAAWAILSNEDITIQYLVTRLNHHKPVKEKHLRQMAIFPANPIHF